MPVSTMCAITEPSNEHKYIVKNAFNTMANVGKHYIFPSVSSCVVTLMHCPGNHGTAVVCQSMNHFSA